MHSEEIHLRDYLKVISKHRGLIIAFMLVTFVVVVLGTISAVPQYRGTTKVMIEKAASDNLTQRYTYNTYDPEYYETQYQLIKSQQVAKRVVELLSLETTYESYLGQPDRSALLEPVKTWFRDLKGTLLAALSPSATEDRQASVPQRSRADLIADRIAAGIEVVPVKDSHIVSIQYASPNPEFAALVANTLAKAYIETTLEMKMEGTRRQLEWMTKKADQERLKLDQAEQEMQSYMRANDLVTLENRLAVIPQKLNQISVELVRAQNEREKLDTLYSKVKQASGSPDAAESILGVTKGNTLQILRDQILKAEQQIRELSNKFGPKHPTMIKALGDLDILQKKKAQEINRLTESIKNEYELAVADEKNLQQQLDKTKAEAQHLNEKFIQYQSYQRELDTNRQLYDALLAKMKEQSLTDETQPVKLWVVEQASIPLQPFKPRTKVNLLLGLVVGLFGGIGLAFFIEYLDQSIRSPEEAEQVLGLPVLGLIPLYKEKQGSIESVVKDQPRSQFAENYRALRTSLMLSSAVSPPRKILITSAGEKAGKSTTALNLAMVYAQSGQKVLLIDGDMRKPRLHKILGINSEHGLSSLLAKVKTDAVILQQTAVANLDFISAGPIPPNPADLLMTDRLQIMLDKLSANYDLIICDSPPLQSVVDGRIMGHLFDGTVLVVKAKSTTFDMARHALKLMKDVNTPVLGLMINALELKKSDYYYAEYYSAYGEEVTES